MLNVVSSARKWEEPWLQCPLYLLMRRRDILSAGVSYSSTFIYKLQTYLLLSLALTCFPFWDTVWCVRESHIKIKYYFIMGGSGRTWEGSTTTLSRLSFCCLASPGVARVLKWPFGCWTGFRHLVCLCLLSMSLGQLWQLCIQLELNADNCTGQTGWRNVFSYQPYRNHTVVYLQNSRKWKTPWMKCWQMESSHPQHQHMLLPWFWSWILCWF